ncbi:MAG: hypothetical protein ACNI26_09630 [Terasakiella sp.]|uniref:hypothetical protein n=1 Tax=unclassified Terasakiella TaxID=2614952 RepID=UPI003B000BDD
MTVVNIDDYRDYTPFERISADELIQCIGYLQKEARKSGFSEVSDLLALANIATTDLLKK